MATKTIRCIPSDECDELPGHYKVTHVDDDDTGETAVLKHIGDGELVMAYSSFDLNFHREPEPGERVRLGDYEVVVS